MKNFKFIISYDGSRYFGWERQPAATRSRASWKPF